MLDSLIDLFLAIDVGLAIHVLVCFLLFVEFSLMICFVALDGRSCGVVTGAWAASEVLTRMGAFGCLIFGVAKTGHFYGVGTGIALYLRDLCSVIPLISCCDWRYRYENVEYVVLVSIMILSLKRQVFTFKVVVLHF